MTEEKTLNINWDFVLKISVLVIFLYFLFLIQNLVIWFIFALILSILFNFLIDFLEKKKIPRIIATFFVYFGLLAIISFFFYKTVPVFLSDIKSFSSNLPLYFQKVSPFLEKIGIKVFQGADSLVIFLENNLGKAGENVLNALVTIFGGVTATLFIIFLSFFFSLEKNLLGGILSNFAPARYQKYVFNLLPRIRRKVSGWFISRVVGALFVGLLSYLVLTILDVKYAFVFSLIIGILDFIPIIGPIIGAVIITPIVMIDSFSQGLFVLVAFVIIQQLENNLLFPVLFKKFIGIPPALVLISLAIGAQLWGLLGAILAIPLAGIIFELVKDYLRIKKQENKAEIL